MDGATPHIRHSRKFSIEKNRIKHRIYLDKSSRRGARRLTFKLPDASSNQIYTLPSIRTKRKERLEQRDIKMSVVFDI